MTNTVFEFSGKSVVLNADGCFESNLTTKIMLRGAIQDISERKTIPESILELGCGCGTISVFLTEYGYLDGVRRLAMSDLSPTAVARAKENFDRFSAQDSIEKISFAEGSGFEPWSSERFDLIINDVSAISDSIAAMSDWFDMAPCDAGEDGIINTVALLEQAKQYATPGGSFLFPVLSISNVRKLEAIMADWGLAYQKLCSQEWPLPEDMVSSYGKQISELRSQGIVYLKERFGRLLAETACYRVKL